MPIYDFACEKCGKVETDVFIWCGTPGPVCCGIPMVRKYTAGNMQVKMTKELYIERMDDIHKAQEQRGERLRFVHPSEVIK